MSEKSIRNRNIKKYRNERLFGQNEFISKDVHSEFFLKSSPYREYFIAVPYIQSKLTVENPKTNPNAKMGVQRKRIKIGNYERKITICPSRYKNRCVSETSVYKPTSFTPDSLPVGTRFLDWLSFCLWKCSPTCQKIN